LLSVVDVTVVNIVSIYVLEVCVATASHVVDDEEIIKSDSPFFKNENRLQLRE